MYRMLGCAVCQGVPYVPYVRVYRMSGCTVRIVCRGVHRGPGLGGVVGGAEVSAHLNMIQTDG